jgi:hypothetical protein
VTKANSEIEPGAIWTERPRKGEGLINWRAISERVFYRLASWLPPGAKSRKKPMFLSDIFSIAFSAGSRRDAH